MKRILWRIVMNDKKKKMIRYGIILFVILGLVILGIGLNLDQGEEVNEEKKKIYGLIILMVLKFAIIVLLMKKMKLIMLFLKLKIYLMKMFQEMISQYYIELMPNREIWKKLY